MKLYERTYLTPREAAILLGVTVTEYPSDVLALPNAREHGQCGRNPVWHVPVEVESVTIQDAVDITAECVTVPVRTYRLEFNRAPNGVECWRWVLEAGGGR